MAEDAFAEEIGWPLEFLHGVIDGTNDFNADFSVALEQALGISARFWMNRQATYELILACQRAEKHRRVAI